MLRVFKQVLSLDYLSLLHQQAVEGFPAVDEKEHEHVSHRLPEVFLAFSLFECLVEHAATMLDELVDQEGKHCQHGEYAGEIFLASVLAIFNLITLLMQSASEMVCSAWQAARKRWVARYQMVDQLRVLSCYAVFRDWDQFLEVIATNELPDRPP